MFVGIVYQINHVPSGALISHHPRADIPVNALRELLSKTFPSTCFPFRYPLPEHVGNDDLKRSGLISSGYLVI